MRPPTLLHPFREVHWDEPYFRAVAAEVDQMAVMLYDTALRDDELYVRLVAKWARQSVDWGVDAHVLLGLPAYDDAGVGYHDPETENLENGMLGVSSGLGELGGTPESYQGIALYSDWEMDENEWAQVREGVVSFQAEVPAALPRLRSP